MPDIGLKDLCLGIVADSAERFLDLQWSDGRFSTEHEHETDEWNFYDQQYILPAALLYVAEHPTNPWYGDERLWEAILRNGRHIIGRVASDGSMAWRLRGVVLGSPFVCQRLTCAWLLAYRVLKERLPEPEAAAWRDTITRACQWLVYRHLIPRRDVMRFTSHEVGTGTNHFSLYLSLIYLAGKEFGKPDWVELASGLMEGLIADQRSGGYWEEHQGPALGYNYLTYDGVAQYTAWSGEGTGLDALRKGLELHEHWTYPDGIPVECIDGRMRHLSGPFLWGLGGFTFWPDGRGYARFLLERLRASGRDHSGETVARVAEAYLRVREGDEEAPPQLALRYRATLDDASVIRKEGPWVAAVSGQCSTPWPENQFCLDRQSLVSVWREEVGLVIDGSNSKSQPELATFCRPARADYMPLGAKLVSVGDHEEIVEYNYSTFKARVRARTVSAQSMELRYEVFEAGEGPVVVTIVPNVGYGETLTAAGRAPMTLGDDELLIQPEGHTGGIEFRGVKLRLPRAASVEYPVSPFNSYSADNTSPPSANRLVVRFPVGEAGVTVRVEMA